MKLAAAINALILVAMVGISLYGAGIIPEDTVIARHWNLKGKADGYSPRNHILIGLPALAAALSLFFMLAPRIDPRRENVRRSLGLLTTSWIGANAVLLLVHYSIVFSAARGEATPPLGLTLYAVSLFFILIGNFMAKSRSNFFFGVRTPWTLSSEHAWPVANRFCGLLFVLIGLGAIATGFLRDEMDGIKVLVAGAVAAALGSVAVSYFAWRADPDRQRA